MGKFIKIIILLLMVNLSIFAVDRGEAEQQFPEATGFLCYARYNDTNPVKFRLAPFYAKNQWSDVWERSKAIFQAIFSEIKGEDVEFTGKPLTPQKTGSGPLFDDAVVEKQLLFEGESINVLYDYAPISHAHFLLVPKKDRPALNFQELDQDQREEIADLTNRIFLWAKKHFAGQEVNVHYFERNTKTARIRVPSFYAHVVVTTTKGEEFFDKIKLLKRVIILPSALSSEELQSRVAFYRENLKL
jgi:diadenosine tetraphosphate (Ap4A) HIT family hydrolase